MPGLAIPEKFDSRTDPDSGQYTRLIIDRNLGLITHITARQQDSEVFRLPLDINKSLFTIRFVKYHLNDLARNKPEGDTNFLGAVVYQHYTGLKPEVVRSDENALVLSYPTLLGQTTGLNEIFGGIKVWTTFSRSADPATAGWIDFDIKFDFPDKIKSYPNNAGSEDYGWQTELSYPDLRFLNYHIQPLDNQPPFNILDPAGAVENFYQSARRNKYVPPMPVSFSAVYKLATESNISYASGFIMAAEDNFGHHKELIYRANQDDTTTPFAFRLIPPMFLKSGQYVRPAQYSLSANTDKFFSGAGITYRLRAFKIGGGLAGVPVDWYDVANLYRKWVKKSRTSKLFRKVAPHPPSPVVANMSPHTIIVNYSLDGQIDPDLNQEPPLQNNGKIRGWLETHPITNSEDVPGNTNEPVPALLARLQDRLNNWSDWEELGGTIITSPAACFRPPNRLEVFAIDRNGHLSYVGWDGSAWGQWKDLSQNLNVVFQSQPAATAWMSGRLAVFASAKDNKLYRAYLTERGWQPVAGLNISALAVAVTSSAPNLLHLFTLGSDQKAQYRSSSNGSSWSAPTNLGSPPGVKLKALGACFRLPNFLYVFASDDKGALWFKSRVGNNWESSWTSLGGSIQDAPTAVSWGNNRVDVFARGVDGKLQHTWMDSGGWSRQWETLGPVDSAPSVISPSQNRLELFARRAPGGALLRRFRDTRLEAQIWGFEIAGFYRYLAGLPPAANVITGDDARFKNGLQALSDQGVLPSATTDPLMPTFDRKRFRGHVLQTDNPNIWVEAIRNRFPRLIQDYLKPPSPSTEPPRGSTIELDVNNEALNDRVLTINRLHPDYVAFNDSISVRARFDGTIIRGAGPLANAFYQTDIHSMCATQALEQTYLTKWLQKGLLDENFRLIEFMKHPHDVDYCYHKGHAHIVPPPAENDANWPNYTNAIGYGPWHTQRLISILQSVQDRGKSSDRNRDAAFSLTVEFVPLENLVPYVDEFYERGSSTARMFSYALPDNENEPYVLIANSTSKGLRTDLLAERRVPVFHFIYSERLSQKMDLADLDNLIHPGYRETYTGISPKRANPMLDVARDDDKKNAPNFATWKGFCENYGANFRVDIENDGHGIAPKNYPTGGGGTYTYNRGLAATFNLRSWVFRYGAAAVMGERIVLPSTWLEFPSDYYEEAISMGVRAARMQMQFKDFFYGGYMLGQTRIINGNKALWAWRARIRNFNDVAKLVEKIFGSTPPLSFYLYDAFSRGTDVEKLSPPNPDKYPKDTLYNAYRITTDKIQHMIWSRDLPNNRSELLYVFANVGNRANDGQGGNPKVKFLYSRGLENGTGWKSIIYTFDHKLQGSPTRPKDIRYGGIEELSMAPRSLAAVRIYQ